MANVVGSGVVVTGSLGASRPEVDMVTIWPTAWSSPDQRHIQIVDP